MKLLQQPASEPQRLAALLQFDVLDTLPEEALDDLTELAAQICDAPISLISLVDEHRQWVKSNMGLPFAETSREVAFCNHVIAQSEVFVVPDASLDARFADNPLVTGASHVRFYAGAPLVTPGGHALGTLCVMDRVPRQLTATQQEALRVLSRQVMAQLNLRRQTRELIESEARLFKVFRNCPVGVAIHRWSDRTFVDVNAAFTTLFGWERDDVVGLATQDLNIVTAAAAGDLRSRLTQDSVLRDSEIVCRTRGGDIRHVLMGIVFVDLHDEPHTITTFVDITARKQAEERLREAGLFAQSTIDALSINVCVLDATGVILATNVAWRRFADASPATAQSARVGDNYLNACDNAIGADAIDTATFAAGIRATIDGERMEFEMEYDCHLPPEDCWFVGRVTRFPGEGPVRVVVAHENITERKRSEMATSWLAAIVESSDDAIIGEDTNGIITSWNRGAGALFGYSPLEMVGAPITRLIPADRHCEKDRILGKIRRGESVEQFETLRQRRDGQLIDVAVTASPIRNSAGTVIGASKVARDITEQKRAEGVLREREEQLRLYAQHSPAAIAMLDRDMKYLVVSRRWMEAYRLGDQSIVGRSHYEVFPDLPPRWLEIHRRSLAGAVESCDEDPFPRANGTIDWIRWETRPWRQADGSIGGIIIFTEDITERKEAGATLRASEERMRFALENAEVGIWDVDYATGVTRWSPTLEAQYGLLPGTFTGTFKAFVERVHPDDRTRVIETLASAVKSGADFSMPCRSIWPDGTVRWLSGAGRIQLGKDGQPVRGVGISMDVTERRTLEEQYQQAQKMEAVGRLAGGVAHDFNNLLSVILGYCELLLADLGADDERRADVVEIQKAGTRASRLTRQLLAFSRKQIIEPSLLDLNQIATDLQAMLERLIREDVRIVLALGPELALVKADRGQVEQIVMNLAVNARDAMPNGGSLTIGTKNVELDEVYAKTHPSVQAGPYVALTVADTGIGMTAAERARIFEPFFTTKDVGKGTGLGLATVYGIVTRSGGSVDVRSELGIGTTFTVYFPKSDETELVVDAPARAPGRLAATQTVLLVEDEDGLREVARKLLQRQGYTVIVAASATEALRLFDEHPSIDVLLTDVVMPDTSGPALTKELIERRPSLKVIYMSGYTEEVIVHHGVLKSGISFLNKPFTSEALGEKIRQVLAE